MGGEHRRHKGDTIFGSMFLQHSSCAGIVPGKVASAGGSVLSRDDSDLARNPFCFPQGLLIARLSAD